jgi:hypothetical protein
MFAFFLYYSYKIAKMFLSKCAKQISPKTLSKNASQQGETLRGETKKSILKKGTPTMASLLKEGKECTNLKLTFKNAKITETQVISLTRKFKVKKKN